MRRDKQARPDQYLDCSDCLGEGRTPRHARASWHCGRMPSSEWLGSGFYAPPSWPVKAGECPGRLIALPQVIEASRASKLADQNLLLARYHEGVTDLLLDSIEIFQSECSATEQAMMEQ